MEPEDLPQDFNLVFKGVDGAEAGSFISSVQWKARTEGRIRDNEWIADLVSTFMKGEALRWYVDLDENTQNDWRLLRKAILQRYPSRAQPPAPSLQPTVPTPAAAAAPPDALNTTYRIQLYFANKKSRFFLSTAESNPRVYVTSSETNALKVRWTTADELRLENGLETPRMIGLSWPWSNRGSDRNTSTGPSSDIDLGLLLISDSLGQLPRAIGYSRSTQVIRWSVDQDDWLQSYSYFNQSTPNQTQASRVSVTSLVGISAQYQHQFFIEQKGPDGSVVQFCLSPGLNSFGVGTARIFTMKLEPV